jgi:hypothetical protein
VTLQPEDHPLARETLAAHRAARRRIAELEESQTWAHHVGDLDGGTVVTTLLARPPAPLARAERMSALGHPIDHTIFGGPAYRLSARVPYQASPEAFLIAEEIALSAFDDRLTWRLPEQPPPGIGGSGALRARFAVSPERRSIVSIAVSGHSWPGRTGEVSVSASNSTALVRVPIDDQFRSHTIDLTFVPLVPETEILMIVERIRTLDFRSISFRAAPLVAQA